LTQQNAFLTTAGLVSAKGELDLMQDKWTKNLAEKIEKSLRDGQQEIDLILKPKNLGKLNLRLAINNHSLNIQIQADNQHVVSLLQDSETRLMQMLDGNGFKSTHLALTSGFGNSPDFGKKQHQSQQQGERNAVTSQNELVKSSKENIMVGADNRSSDYVKTGVDVIA
jgi:flagellar hook-length control protein FliK